MSTPHRTDWRWWILIGAVAVIAVGAAVGITATVVKKDVDATSPTATPPSTPTTSTPATSAPPPATVDAVALPSLLLSAEDVSTRMASPGMVAGPVESAPNTGVSVTPVNCAGAWDAIDNATYSGSGFTALAGQAVTEQPTPYHKVSQAVVSFPDAISAKAFYDKQVDDWNACKFQKLTAQYGDGTNTGTVGVTSVTDGVASLLFVLDVKGSTPVNCERAIAPRLNVIVDVRACSPDIGSAGSTLARAIGNNVKGVS